MYMFTLDATYVRACMRANGNKREARDRYIAQQNYSFDAVYVVNIVGCGCAQYTQRRSEVVTVNVQCIV